MEHTETKKLKEPLVNVVILTCNQFKYINNCIKALLNCDYKNLRIILVDNNSNFKEYQSFYKKNENNRRILMIRLERNVGFAAGCNRAMREVKNGYIVFLNDDVIVTKSWLLPIITYMEKNTNVGACQPKMKDMRKKDYFEYAGAAGGFMDVYGYPFCRGRIFFDIEKDKGQYDDTTDLVWCSGACMVTKTSVMKKIGNFDEIFFIYGEESDLCWRMFYYGYRLVYIPTSIVDHYGSGTMKREIFRKTYLHHRNGLILLLKNYSYLDLLKYLPIRIMLDFFAFWYYLVLCRHFKNALAVIAAYLNLIYLSPLILERRKTAFFKNPKNNKKKYPLYKKSLVFSYFIQNKKRFSQLDQEKIEGYKLLT